MTSDQEPKPKECRDCYAEDRPLHANGLCNQCETFQSPDVHKREARGDFKYEVTYGGPLQTFICLKCGADRFIVGRESYHTAIKCVTCGWERCIHDG